MVQCALCLQHFLSRSGLVQHYTEAHSVARQRPRRTRVTHALGRVVEEQDHRQIVVVHDTAGAEDPSEQPLLQPHPHSSDGQTKKPIICSYCGQRFKDWRGGAIHRAFCEKKLKKSPSPSQASTSIHPAAEPQPMNMSLLYECMAEDCGAIFRNEEQLKKHVKRHHRGEQVVGSRSSLSLEEAVGSHDSATTCSEPPLVTVTMKPHVGRTEGLQDLSLLITPSKMMDDSSTFFQCEEKVCHSVEVIPPACTDEGEGRASCSDINQTSEVEEAVLYVGEDGTLLEAAHHSGDKLEEEEEAFILITGDSRGTIETEVQYKCKFCRKHFANEHSLAMHISNYHRRKNKVVIKQEPDDSDDGSTSPRCLDDNGDEDWELVSFGRMKKVSGSQVGKGKCEYRCSMCKRTFLSELSYQQHIRSKECRHKKFKLPRMFSCHYRQCDSSFFKLTELQRHWQIAHKYTMASNNLTFDDERTFTDWLAKEEEKYKVRFTCDVRRRKPHRTERLLVCHRFHHLRTAAARRSARKEYSDKHNWVHKIEPCLCYARMKVYQDYCEDTCDYTGTISVVYYHEHSHSKVDRDKDGEVINHILQRNKRNRANQFRDLTGTDKILHRQKLEKFARLAGKDYRAKLVADKSQEATKKKKMEVQEQELNEDDMERISTAQSLLGNDELFSTQVEMVLDGQFEMGPEVVTQLENFPIFSADSRVVEEVPENTVVQVMKEKEEATEIFLSTEDWRKLFEMVRCRVAKEESAAVRAEAALLLPYEKVIDLVSPSDKVPIFRQLWDLANPLAKDSAQLEISIVRS